MKNDKILLDVLKVNQPIGTFYISTIPAKTLLGMSIADIRMIESGKDKYFGIQRKLDKKRIKEVGKYIKTIDASFPNSIILNVSSDNIIYEDIKENQLCVKVTSETFIIIDGQHRLAGFIENTDLEFDLVVTIFIDLDIEQQAKIFTTINSEQRKVSSSLSLDLEQYNTINTPRKVAHNLAMTFNVDKDSPWFQRIKMLGYKDELSQEGIITQSAFVKPILNYIYSDEDNVILRDNLLKAEKESNDNLINEIYDINRYDNNKFILWAFYATKNEKAIYKVLFNYFLAFSNSFSEQWGNSKFLLTKTTGYNAIMRLFKDLFLIGYKKGDVTYEFFHMYTEKLTGFSSRLTSEYYGASGEQASKNLYDDFIDVLKINDLQSE